MISLDANSKLGKDWIPEDSHEQSPNGKVLSGILKTHALFVVNSLKGKRVGVITRRRNTVDSDEKSTIDFVILSGDLVEDVETVRTDEEQINSLAKFSKTKGVVKVTKNDHNPIITKFKVEFSQKTKKESKKLFNLKSIDGQKKFKLLTSKPGILSDIFKDDTEDIESLSKKFFKRLNGILHQCFKKIRVTDHENKEITKLFGKRRLLRTKSDNKSITSQTKT